MMESNPRAYPQAKGAVTLTLAAVVLSSGLWALWYTPALSYEPRKSEQITNISFLLKPGSSAIKNVEIGKGVQELSVTIWPQTVVEDPEKDHLNIPPVISAKIIDSQGRIVRTYDNVTTVPDEQGIQVTEPGAFKVEVSNNGAENALQVELRATDNSKIPNHPMEAMGQWLTVISMPVFGLAGWFIVSRRRQASPS